MILQPLHNMKLSIVTDASFANNGYHSQGGQMVIAHEPGLRDGLKVKTNLVGWRSGRLQRVVNSTLAAAETQSLSRGLGDLMWIMVSCQGAFRSQLPGERLEAAAQCGRGDGTRLGTTSRFPQA